MAAIAAADAVNLIIIDEESEIKHQTVLSVVAIQQSKSDLVKIFKAAAKGFAAAAAKRAAVRSGPINKAESAKQAVLLSSLSSLNPGMFPDQEEDIPMVVTTEEKEVTEAPKPFKKSVVNNWANLTQLLNAWERCEKVSPNWQPLLEKLGLWGLHRWIEHSDRKGKWSVEECVDIARMYVMATASNERFKVLEPLPASFIDIKAAFDVAVETKATALLNQ